MQLTKQFFLRKSTRRAGFTLVELLVVIAIIGVLSVMFYSNYSFSKLKARDAKRKNDLVQIAKSLELYYNDYGQYPAVNSNKIQPAWSANGIDWGTPFQNLTTSTVYMGKMPADPSGDRTYVYDSDGTSFRLFAKLENERDPQLEKNPSVSGSENFTNRICIASGSEKCNFSVTSPNIDIVAVGEPMESMP